jgi:NitT/TauT family transport system substrate-binding protein
MKKFVLFGLCLILFAASVTAKAQSETAAPLRVGIMPDADSLPFIYARDYGFFEREGVKVELIVFSNPQERDAAIQAGRLDGTISDVLAAAFLAAGG